MSDIANGAPRRETLASFSDYTGAQAAVDRLSDRGFPVELIRVDAERVLRNALGTGIRLDLSSRRNGRQQVT